jgi:hypothetical protein
MRKKMLFLVALFTSFAMTSYAQDCTDITLTVGGGSYDSEISWSLGETNGLAGSYDVCLEDGLYSFDMVDSYGDGWNGATFTMTDADGNIIASGGLESGAAGSVSFTVGEVAIAGCTDAIYLEYDAMANEDDGSCATMVVEGCLDANADNYDETANFSGACEYSCPLVADGTNYLDGTCYLYVWSYAYSIEEVESFGYDCSCVEAPIYGCMDETADNYDETATSPSACEYTVVCTDDETEVSVMMMDSWGDGWDNGTLVVGDNTLSLPGGSEASATLCLADGVYAVTAGGSSYASEVSWTLSIDTVEVMSGGGDFAGDLVIGEPAIAGCMDPLALNYSDIASEDDGSCVYCEGTTLEVTMSDSWGDGWNGNVLTIGSDTLTLDAGSAGSATLCLADGIYYVTCDGGLYQTEVSWSIGDVLSGGAPFSGSINIGNLPEPGCTDSTAFNFDPMAGVDDGSCEPVVLGCTDGSALNHVDTANTDDGSCEYVPGCTDNTAVNFDPAATEDDGSCFYTSCLGTSATVTVGGGAWDGEITIIITNADGQSPLSGGAGTYDVCLDADSVYTITMLDSYGDGWNGATFSITTCDGAFTAAEGGLLAGSEDSLSFSIQSCDSYAFGCMDSIASNYDEYANEDDGSCIYPGCTDAMYLEFDAMANEDDGSCVTMVMEGCMDALASNFDSLANVEDGSCILPIACDSGLTGMVIYMNDSYGDGWNGNEYSLVSASGEVVATGGLPSEGFTVTPEGTSGSDTLCVAPGCFAISVAGGSYVAETSWSISTEFNGEAIASGGGDNTASTVSLGTDDDCSSLLGCNDSYATNYNADAIANDGSCEYLNSANCEDAISMELNSSYNGNFGIQTWFSITLDEAMFISATAMPQAGFFYEGTVEVHTACDSTDELLSLGALDAGTYLISCDNSSIFANEDGYVLAISADPIVSGCTDPYADNYDETANIDDESCLYPCEGISGDLVITTGNIWAYEYYWELLDDAGMIMATGGADGSYDDASEYVIPLCMADGVSYTMNTYDTYGDGWGGTTSDGSYAFIAECDDFTYIAANNGGESPSDPASVSDGTYHLESSEVFTLVPCADVSAGCMDETAFNYDSLANVSSGDCVPFIYGCMDMEALNYDADANTDTPEDCVFGCNGEYVTVSVETGTWSTEVSWNLFTSLGDTLMSGGNGTYADATVYAEQVCLPLGGYVFQAIDAYGDGWNGGSFSVITSCDGLDIALVGALPTGVGADYIFDVVSCDDITPGCTDTNADNYDMDASNDDGSCVYPVPQLQYPADGTVIDLAAVDSINFAWDTLFPTIPSFYYIYFSTDADDPVGSAAIQAVVYDTEWTDFDGLYNLFIDNGYGAGDEFPLYWWITPTYYTYEGAFEAYNGSVNSLTLTISAVNGCMDESAMNYNDGATLDDGSCIFPCETGLTLSMNDSYGDGWNGNELLINGVSYSLPSEGFAVTPEGTSDVVCVDIDAASCINIEWVMGSYATETSWSLMNSALEVIAEGGAGSGIGAIGDCAYGCTDDSYAEYDANAEVDDGSCATLLCAGTVVSMDGRCLWRRLEWKYICYF